MGQQTISIDPDLWKRTRRFAFDTGVTASSIVEAALTEHLDVLMAKPRTGGKPPVDTATVTPRVKVLSVDAAATIAADAPDPKPLSAKISGPLPWTRVDTPEDAAKVAAFVPSFNPVPKPGATKKARAR